MNNISRLPIVFFCVLFPLTIYAQELSLASLFTDALVLQQKSAASIWGKGTPGSTVFIAGSWGKKASVRVNVDGTWKTELQTPKAGGPYTVTVSQNSTFLTLKDVQIGEVWLCSGQSNMEMPLRGWPPGDTISGSTNEIPNARFPKIRMFVVERNISVDPKSECTGSWKECTPEAAAAFSATAYFFGKKLHRELNVPIGLILSSWGGTPVQAWMSKLFITTIPRYSQAVEDLKKIKQENDSLATWLSACPMIDLAPFRNSADWSAFPLEDSSIIRPGTFDSSWRTMFLPQGWERTEIGAFDGILWFRKKVTVPNEWRGTELKIDLGPIDDVDAAFVNGVKIGGTETGNSYNVPRTYVVPALLTGDSVMTIAVRVIDYGGGGGMWGTASQMRLHSAKSTLIIPLSGDWNYLPIVEIRGGMAYRYERHHGFYDRPRISSEFGPQQPTSLYNGMIAPLVPYSIKGTIWYQGESNTSDPEGYAELFPLMIRNWRTEWRKQFSFYFVQIAPFEYGPATSSQRLREAQLRTLSVPFTGMAVALDIGDSATIHPSNKKEVGERLARWALAKDYGKRTEYTGPVYRSFTVQKNNAVLSFEHAEGLVIRPKAGKNYFSIAGSDSIFHPADVTVSGKKLYLHSENVKKPIAVRYAWGNVVEGTLFNAAGLPASSFRTDVWK